MGPPAQHAKGRRIALPVHGRSECRILCRRLAGVFFRRTRASRDAALLHCHPACPHGAMTMSHPVKSPKKLIEVALPLDAINAAAAREKSIRHGHPSTLHLWWARRPLAAARAVIFAQMVNDPSWKWELEHQGEAPPNNLKASWA